MKNLPKAAFRQLKQESLEIVREAGKQVVGTGAPEVQDEDGELTEEQKREINVEAKKRTEQFDADIQRYRQLRKERDDEIERQRFIETKSAGEPKHSPLPQPTSKPKGGLAGMAAKIKRKQVRAELGKVPSG